LTIGIELLLVADLCIVAESTRFAQIEVKRGIFPVGGATVRLVQELGWGNAMRILLTGEEFSAHAALRWGLVQQVVAHGQQLERALALAQTVASQSPVGVRATLASARRDRPGSRRRSRACCPTAAGARAGRCGRGTEGAI
jgi:enoyl-CoA hydratase/carnithine racemase